MENYYTYKQGRYVFTMHKEVSLYVFTMHKKGRMYETGIIAVGTDTQG